MKMRHYVHDLSSSPHIICIQRMCDVRVGSPKIPYEGEEPYTIGYNGKGVPLVHALLDVQEVT